MGDEPDGSAGFAQQAMDAVSSGRINIHPASPCEELLLIGWVRNASRCISRQLWWGHRSRSGTAERSESDLEKAFAGRGDVAGRKAGESGGWLLCAETDLRGDELGPTHNLAQDPDVLDTWFSSALWPHSTLGWPEETAELKKFYPTSVLSTARDIITLWVARMAIFGLFNRAEVPFRDVYIHPIIQDGKGRRMSKSAGNGVDPVDIMEIHGADALRFTLAAGATETQDLRIPVEPLKLPDGREINTSDRFEQGRNFANKFWNAARLTLMNLEGYEPASLDLQSLAIEDRWILDRLDCTIEEVTADFEQFQFAEAVRRLRDFTWGDFCDWYLEFVKGRLRDEQSKPDAQRVLAAVLDSLCRLLHPIIPFVTEQVWQGLNALGEGAAAYRSPLRPRRVSALRLGRSRQASGT